MSTPSLATVAHQVITTYGNTARNVIQAYRVGGERAFVRVDQAFAAVVDKTAERVNPKLRSSVVAVEQMVSGFYAKRVSMSSDGADFAVNRVVTIAEMGVTQVAANANRFEKATRTQALSSIATAALPAARVVQEVGAKLEAQSEALVSKVNGATRKRRAAAPKTAAVKALAVRPTKKAAPAKARAKPLVTAKAVKVAVADAKPEAKAAPAKTRQARSVQAPTKKAITKASTAKVAVA